MYLVLEGCLLPGVGIPACTEADTHPPPVNRMTDRCKNITLATTSLRPVKIEGAAHKNGDIDTTCKRALNMKRVLA